MLITTLVVSVFKDRGSSFNPQPPHTKFNDQRCFSLQPGHYSNLTAPNLQHTVKQGTYNFKFTVLMNTKNTSNYQSTNEAHYTQQNTLQATTKRQRTLHRTHTHTTKSHNFTLTLTPPSLQNETTNVVINITVASS